MKNIFSCKKYRSDVEIGASFLSGYVKLTIEQDLRKLYRIMNFLVEITNDAAAPYEEDSDDSH